MDDYISRQAAIDAIKETPIYVTLNYGIGAFPVVSTETALNQIVDLPSADVVEVVRCRDCIRYDTHDKRCRYWNHGVGVDLNGFCSKGERRTDGEIH